MTPQQRQRQISQLDHILSSGDSEGLDRFYQKGLDKKTKIEIFEKALKGVMSDSQTLQQNVNSLKQLLYDQKYKKFREGLDKIMGLNKQQKQQFVGEGGFGTAYRITSPEGKKLIRKKLHIPIQTKQFVRIRDIISSMDPESNYFTGLVKNLQGSDHMIDTLQMSDGGLSLDKIDTPLQASKILAAFPSLLKAVYLLIQHGYIHGDIKDPNIVFDQQSSKLRLIDFDFLDPIQIWQSLYREQGLIGRVGRVKKNTTRNVYEVWPPELYDNIDAYLDNKWVKKLLTGPPLESIREYYGKNPRPEVDFTKLDIWGLGMVAYIVLRTAKPLLTDDLHDNILGIIMDFLLNPDPSQRSIENAYNDWYEYFLGGTPPPLPPVKKTRRTPQQKDRLLSTILEQVDAILPINVKQSSIHQQQRQAIGGGGGFSHIGVKQQKSPKLKIRPKKMKAPQTLSHESTKIQKFLSQRYPPLPPQMLQKLQKLSKLTFKPPQTQQKSHPLSNLQTIEKVQQTNLPEPPRRKPQPPPYPPPQRRRPQPRRKSSSSQPIEKN